jgi:ATP-dependent Zn protease
MTIYDVSNLRQLIDINNDIVNFTASIKIEMENDGECQIAIITENNLSRSDGIDYKTVVGGIEMVVSNEKKNTFETTYLMIKSENPTRCNIEMNVKDDGVIQEVRSNDTRERVGKTEHKKGSNKQKFISVAVIILIIIIVSFFLYKNRNPTSIYNSVKL